MQRGMKFLTYAAPAIRNAMMDMVRDAFAAFEQRMVTEDKDGVCYQRVSLDDVLPGEEQLRRIEAIADPYAMQPQSIMEEQESRRELYDGLKRLTQREQTYLLYRYGFTDGKEHPLIGTAIYFHLTKGRAQKTEEQAMDNLWLELPWWFIWIGREIVLNWVNYDREQKLIFPCSTLFNNLINWKPIDNNDDKTCDC